MPITLLAIGLTLLPIVAVTWAWSKGAVNVPKWDDHVLKFFLLGVEQATTVGGTFFQFVKQHNEHRIAYDRLFTWLDYTLFGKLSFVRLMAYGNLSLLGLVGLFATILARYVKAWYVYLPPVAFFIVSLAQWENLYWAMSALQNFSVVFWLLWSLYALTHRDKPTLAIILAVVTTFVSGNGLLVWPVGVLALLVQRRYALLPYWLAATGLLVGLYFWDYAKPQSNPPARGTLPELITGALAFLGAAADALPLPTTYWLSAITGGLLVGFWGYVLSRRLPDIRRGKALSPLDAFMLGAIVFIVGTAAVVVWGRYGFGRDTLLTSRYKVYSLTLLAITYVYCLSVGYKKWRTGIGWAGLAVSGLLWWSAFVINSRDMAQLRQYLLTSQYNWTYSRSQPVSALDGNTSRLINNAPAYYDTVLPTLFAPPGGPVFPIDSVQRINDQYVVRLAAMGVQSVGWPSLSNPDRGVSVLLRSTRRTYLYGDVPQPRRHWRTLVGLLPLYPADAPLDVRIPVTDLEPGTYDIAVVTCAGGTSCQVRPTGRLLTAAPHAPAAQVNKNW